MESLNLRYQYIKKFHLKTFTLKKISIQSGAVTVQPNLLMDTLYLEIVLKKCLNEFNKKEYKVNTSIDWWKNEIIESVI